MLNVEEYPDGDEAECFVRYADLSHEAGKRESQKEADYKNSAEIEQTRLSQDHATNLVERNVCRQASLLEVESRSNDQVLARMEEPLGEHVIEKSKVSSGNEWQCSQSHHYQ